jgi:O-acetylserine/cysteine efflux transporter
MQQFSDAIIIGIMAGLLEAILYAASVTVYKSQAEGIRPIAVSGIKIWVTMGLMTILVLMFYGSFPASVPSDTILVLALTIVGPVVADTLYIQAQDRIGVAFAFPIAYSYPIMTYLLSVAFLGDVLLVTKLGGVILAVTGIAIISYERNKESLKEVSLEEHRVVGIILALLALSGYAASVTLLQVGVEGVDPVPANFIRSAFGAIAFLPIYAGARSRGMPRPTKRSTGIVAVAALFGFGFGSLLYTFATKYVGATITSLLDSMAPIFGVAIAVPVLGEKVTKRVILGTIMSVLGVAIVILGF